MNRHNFHTVLRRQGSYTLTVFDNKVSAENFVWAMLKRDKRLKFAILRNRDNKIVETFNDPRWSELKQYGKLKR